MKVGTGRKGTKESEFMKIIYYPDVKTVFYCQDKNASTTLVDVFERTLESTPEIFWDTSNTDPSPPKKLDEILSRPIDLQFTVVRNSWDRMSSLYKMLKIQLEQEWDVKPKGHLHPWFGRFEAELVPCLNAEDSFDEFIKYICSHDDSQVDSHWQSQAVGLPLGDSQFFIARLEHLQRDWDTLTERMKLPASELSVSNNRTCHLRDHYSHDYSDHAIELVRERYSEEIKLFGFQFDREPIFSTGDPILNGNIR